MRATDLVSHGAHVMTVCNACRYCEQYCPVFPAMERRLTFSEADLHFLANLCHNCGECLYACQYAPPHEFGIDVPHTLAGLRLASYEAYCWPRPLARAFRASGVATSLALSAAMTVVMLAAALWSSGDRVWAPVRGADFYAVIPHGVMVTLFGGVAAFVAVALAIGLARFWRDIGSTGGAPDLASGHVGASGPGVASGVVVASGFSRTSIVTIYSALRDALTLRHLHTSGADCTSAEETRTPWRRVFHHATFYGFLLCFASTSVAAFYHSVLGWEAPYPYASAPVLLGTLGGLGLIVGPVGLFVQRRRRDPDLSDPEQDGMDTAFIAMLFLTSLTGLLLLARRETPFMTALLIVHLGVVLALFVTLPYGKFVHGLYRLAALVRNAQEQSR
jgi:citrate/tricarballylate utilization protein